MALRVLSLVRGFVLLGLLTVVLFGAAGRWDLPFFWAYIGITALVTLVAVFTVDPELQMERWHPAVREKDFWLVAIVIVPCMLALLLVAGLDVGRFHWSDRAPLGVRWIGLVVYAVSAALAVWATAVNRFFSPVVRIQAERGHHLITAGPYQYVRHPGYATGILAFLSSPLALGSWWAVAPVVPIVIVVVRRAAWEDRFLHAELDGYTAYAQRVPYRLLPGFW